MRFLHKKRPIPFLPVKIVLTQICKSCGTRGEANRYTQGNILIAILLCLYSYILAIIYAVWMLSTRYDVCRDCGSRKLISPYSPIGKKMVKEFDV